MGTVAAGVRWPLAGAKIEMRDTTGRIVRVDGKPLSTVADSDGVYEMSLSGVPAGEYTITVTVPNNPSFALRTVTVA